MDFGNAFEDYVKVDCDLLVFRELSISHPTPQSGKKKNSPLIHQPFLIKNSHDIRQLNAVTIFPRTRKFLSNNS
jgi:hypothetical protein